MKYELLETSDRGIVVDSTPILRDIKDTFAVSFILPDSGAYIALFRDEKGIEYKSLIRKGIAHVPNELFHKEQHIGLTVCRIEDERITRAWECQSLYIGAFLYMRKTQWQITVGADDAKLYERLATIERQHAETLAAFEALRADYGRCMADLASVVEKCKQRVCEAESALASLKTTSEAIAIEHNKAISVINNISERLKALECNYDPTIIK